MTSVKKINIFNCFRFAIVCVTFSSRKSFWPTFLASTDVDKSSSTLNEESTPSLNRFWRRGLSRIRSKNFEKSANCWRWSSLTRFFYSSRWKASKKRRSTSRRRRRTTESQFWTNLTFIYWRRSKEWKFWSEESICSEGDFADFNSIFSKMGKSIWKLNIFYWFVLACLMVVWVSFCGRSIRQLAIMSVTEKKEYELYS